MAAPSIGEMLAAAKSADPESRDVPVVLDRSVASQLDAIAERIADLEAELDEQESRFQAERDAIEKDKRFADPRPAELDERERAALAALQEQLDAREADRGAILHSASITLRFLKLPGQEWSAITATTPPRPNVPLDAMYGYNYHAVAKRAALYRDADGRPYAVRVITEPAEGDTDGAPTERTEELEPEQWADLWNLLSGGEFERIATQVFDLNDYSPRRRAEAAKKA